MKKYFNYLLAILLILTISFTLASYTSTPSNLLTKYKYSQYCLAGYRLQHGWDKLSPQYQLWCDSEDDYRGMMDDPELFTLAGILYSKQADPSSINPELQPLTKYLFGFSYALFSSPLPVQYLALILIFFILYQEGKRYLPFLWALIAPVLFTYDAFKLGQLSSPYLDLVQTLFILLFIVNIHSPRRAFVLIGLGMLAKSFSTGFVLLGLLILYLLLTDKSRIRAYLKSIWLAMFIYVLGYAAFFFYHHPFDFFTLHLNILKLYRSYVPEYPLGEIFRIIFTGKWLTWYGDHGLIAAPGWSPLWPLSLVVFTFSLFTQKLRYSPLLPHYLWVLCYLAFISLRLVFPRYLLPLLPSLYLILAIYLQFATVYLWTIFKSKQVKVKEE